ncbi:hypothetical protein ABVT39_023091 [Epinephelus coioides]
MSDSNLDPVPEDFNPGLVTLPEIAATPPSCRRRSTRLAQRDGSPSDESEHLLSQLQDHGIFPAPGLPLSQLHGLAVEAAHHNPAETSLPSAHASNAPAGSSAVPAHGRKRTRKSGPSKAPQPKKTTPAALTSSSTSGNTLVSTLQSLANFMSNIDARLRALETTSAPVSFSVTLTGVQASMLQPAFTPSQPSLSTPPEASHHSLATAIPVPPLGRPFIPYAANISPRLKAKILQGRDVNLVSLILPSPECDRSITNGGDICKTPQFGLTNQWKKWTNTTS